MLRIDRRLMLGGIASGWASLAAAQTGPSGADGHAAGFDVAGSSSFVPLVPRRTGDAAAFTASLDKASIKATSGGWAREITARQLPLATRLAGAHLFLNPGGAREIHWHTSAEWAYVMAGACQVSVIDQNGELEVANYGPGDLWYFPAGHAHAIQTLGDAPCHAILVFNDGLYSEHGTFGISDVLSRFGPEATSRHLGVPSALLADLPSGETYIAQGSRLALDGPEAAAASPLAPGSTHRHRLEGAAPWFEGPGGSVRIASSKEFPLSADMTGLVGVLKPGATQVLHWHPAAEWLYVATGTVVMSLLHPDKRLATAQLSPGDCAYVPANCVHCIQNTGNSDATLIGALDSGTYAENALAAWLFKAPGHLLLNNLHLAPEALAALKLSERIVIASG